MSTLGRLVRGWRKLFARTAVTSLSDDTMQELRHALTEQLKRPDGPTSEVTDLLRKVAREAREQGVRPEELLVTFKQLWNSLSESFRPQLPDQHEQVRQNLVTLCIQAYYAE
jgi:hypothetical protein